MATEPEGRRISITSYPDHDQVQPDRRMSMVTYPDHDQKQPDRRMSIQPASIDTSYKGYRIVNAIRLFWAFTESDFMTFVIPNTMFGIFTALAGLGLVKGRLPAPIEVAMRLPLVVWFNWYSVFIFDLANQRSPESIREDLINKPWRPLPSGKITSEQTRRTMLVAIPVVFAMNYALGVWEEGAIILILTWLQNDLRGGDEIVRDLIIAIAYAFFNLASLRIALGMDGVVTDRGYIWIAIVSGIILTTMHVQDLKDQEGDRTRGRKTAPLVFGETPSRWMIAGFLPIWSIICGCFWQPGPLGSVPPAVMSIYVAVRVLDKRDPRDDSKTWKLWCLWHTMIYLLPVIRRF